MNRDKIKLISNVPLIFTMEGGEQGKEVTSNFNDNVEYRYYVTHRGAPSILYLPYDGAKAVSLTKAQTDDEVELTKAVIGREIQYFARVLRPGQQPAPAPPSRLLAPQPVYAPRERQPAPPPPTYFQPEAPLPMWDEINDAPQTHVAAPTYQHGAAARAPEQQSFAVAPAAAAKAPAAEFTPPIPMEAGSPTQLLYFSLKNAADAVINIEAYLAFRGRPAVFSEESLRACALTLRINAAKEGR